MSLSYGVGGATTALAVIGACKMRKILMGIPGTDTF
jgi:hypothetical protein